MSDTAGPHLSLRGMESGRGQELEDFHYCGKDLRLEFGLQEVEIMAMTAAPPPSVSEPPPPQAPRMRTGHVLLVVFGSLLALVGLALTAIAISLGWVAFAQRDGRFLTTSTERYAVDSHALTTQELKVLVDPGMPTLARGDIARVLVRGTSARADGEIFIGIGPQSEVSQYLTSVEHSELTDVRVRPFRPEYRTVPGTKPPAPPGEQGFWVVSAQGPGTQQVETVLRSGSWVVVVMNADASRPIAVDLQAGARTDLFGPITIAVLIGALALLAIGVPLLVLGAAGLGRDATRPPALPSGTAPAAGGATMVRSDPSAAAVPVQSGALADSSAGYPAHLRGDLDPQLSRWMWLVKWFLAIPHFILLAFLWLAFLITTVIAGFAILFTGRYPRSLFDFNVGVVRWSWRVGFYAYSALGTDQYPPFTLARTSYPADFDVEFPERLSRGLVLVKWWLLAIPHLVIVALFTTPWYWISDPDWTTNAQRNGGISLLGVLVLIAALVLLFTGRYPRPLFDFILGLNRWIYRVTTYVALMRDEYPPFRLDQGPHDPADSRPLPEATPLPPIDEGSNQTADQR
jgi:hypothetical protein